MKKLAIASQGCIRFFNFDSWTEEASDRIEINKSSG
jgi:hypothetical protein